VLLLEHAVNRNKIITVASARNKTAAQNTLRGKSIPLLWGDEWGFAPYNEIIYLNTVPAFKRAADNARANGAPYGILFTTTPGFLTSTEGVFAYQMKEDAVHIKDITLMAYLLDPTRANYGMTYLCERFSQPSIPATENEMEWALQAQSLYRMNDIAKEEMKTAGVWDLYKTIELPLLRTLCVLEKNGIYMDVCQ